MVSCWGEELIIWKQDNSIFRLKDDDFYWAVKAKQITVDKVKLLIDPSFSDECSVWEFDIRTYERKKLKDIHIPDTDMDNIDW